MEYIVEIDNCDHVTWENNALEFADYSIYQTWAYQENRCQMSNQQISRAIVRNRDGNVCLMCQVRIKHIKPLGLRIGYVQWGPLLLMRDGSLSCSKEALSELKHAYLGTKVDVLRFVPNICDDDVGKRLSSMLTSSGFQHIDSVVPYRTFMVCCEHDEDYIRKGLRKSFRRDLKKAENLGVEIYEGVDDESIEILKDLYNESIIRKGFTGLDIDQFVVPQKALSCDEKMRVIVAYRQGKIASALLCTNLGNCGIVLLAASNEVGLECGSSYIVWYHAAISALNAGMKCCDLGGIDPDNNASVYRFKSRMGGKEVSHIGCFEACSGFSKRLIWRVTEKIYHSIKNRL